MFPPEESPKTCSRMVLGDYTVIVLHCMYSCVIWTDFIEFKLKHVLMFNRKVKVNKHKL